MFPDILPYPTQRGPLSRFWCLSAFCLLVLYFIMYFKGAHVSQFVQKSASLCLWPKYKDLCPFTLKHIPEVK